MSTKIHRSTAERFGRWLGGVWRAYSRREQQALAWLVVQGVPADGAAPLLWAIKLGVLAILFYAVFWLALLFVFALVGTWVIRHDNGSYDEEHKAEWRDGHSGWGLYDKNEWRHDMGGSDEDQ